ncbi:hypothetical protein DNL40_01640 [Xylanimonas oleitrophica]|uniref:Uncharacterized protein n=1 Tax=Xylanimonas oleitrophica TaxID=2607479 RepID=A0A2W5WWV5_9MICO|nr:hypothetical protein [Xylanimonas oleitrophica]PZR55113.1 hypothetical protein DNL40_01640 [Xylanimonas oleitrophica]
MLLRLTPAEALGLARLADVDVPPVVTSVAADDGVVRVSADLRRLDDLPGPLRLAARLAPVVRAELRVLSFAAGVATVGVEVNAAGLPAHKLLRLAAEPLERALVRQGLPAGAVDIRSDATVAVDVAALLEQKAPGLDVTRLAVEGQEVVVEASVG